MMSFIKTILVALLFLVTYATNAQVQIDYNGGSPQFQKIIELDSSKKATSIYKSALKWVTLYYKNPASVIQGQLENELIKGQGSSAASMGGMIPTYQPYTYNFAIEIKDSRVRVTVDNMSLGYIYIYKSDGTLRTNSQARAVLESLTTDANAFINSLTKHLTSPSPKSDW